MAKLGMPTSGTMNWQAATCRCRFGWLPRDGLVIGPVDATDPDFYEPCERHQLLGGDAAHRAAQEESLLLNMTLCHVKELTPLAELAGFEYRFEIDGTMVFDAPGLAVAEKARLAAAVNGLAGGNAIRVR